MSGQQDEVCDIFNNFFVNVAKNIGNNQINADEAILMFWR